MLNIPIAVCSAQFVSLYHKRDRFMGAAGCNYASVNLSDDGNAVAKCPERFMVSSACSTCTQICSLWQITFLTQNDTTEIPIYKESYHSGRIS